MIDAFLSERMSAAELEDFQAYPKSMDTEREEKAYRRYSKAFPAPGLSSLAFSGQVISLLRWVELVLDELNRYLFIIVHYSSGGKTKPISP